MTDNRKQAMAYGISLEKKLEKHKMKENFDEEFDKLIVTKCLREIPEEEQKQLGGPVHYVPLQLLVNPDSTQVAKIQEQESP